jgi:ABC-type uncharacterized transport system substrate-binding protein
MVILAHGGSTVRPLLQSTHSIPIVFTIVTDPVGNGYVESLARPGRNATGFMVNDYSLNAKYPELLKEIAPGISQVAVLRDASQGAGTGDFAVIQAMAPLLRMQANVIDLREAGEIESAVAAFAHSPNGGLIMPGSAAGRHYRDLIISLAARHKLPAVYSERHFAAAGGLITYGANWIDQYRLAWLRGSHPQRGESQRSAGAGADEIRAGDQSQDREGAWPGAAGFPSSS